MNELRARSIHGMMLVRKNQSIRRKTRPSVTDYQKSYIDRPGIDHGLSLRTQQPEVPTMYSLD